MSWKFMVGIILLIILIIVGFVVVQKPFTDKEALCCQECLNAFSTSPVGVGPEAAECGKFTTAEPLSKKCSQYFETNPTTVSLCMKE